MSVGENAGEQTSTGEEHGLRFRKDGLFIEEPRVESHAEGKFVFRIELPATDTASGIVGLHHYAVSDAIVQTKHPHGV